LNSGPWVTLPTLFCDGFFWGRVSRTICRDWLQNVILLISASWVAEFTGMSYQGPALDFVLFCFLPVHIICRITLWIPTKQFALILIWDCNECIDQVGKYWTHDNIESSHLWTWLFYLVFLLSEFCSSPHIDFIQILLHLSLSGSLWNVNNVNYIVFLFKITLVHYWHMEEQLTFVY
jgi:hypothetical protein